jgi:subtilisin family serine protease
MIGQKGLRLAFFALLLAFPRLSHAVSCSETPELLKLHCSEYLVKFSPRTSSEKIEAILQKESLAVIEYFETGSVYHVDGDPARDPGILLKELNDDPDVIYAEPNYALQANAIPNDPRFSDLWAFQNDGQFTGLPGVDIGMASVWDEVTGREPIVVAVLDSGIDYTHEDLAENMWVNPGEIPNNHVDDDHNGYVDDVHGYNFFANTGNPADDFFHGTHVAGIIGAVGNNGIGITGVDWNVKLMALKFMGPDGRGDLADAIRGIDYAVKNGAKIINSSWDFAYPWITGLPANPLQEPVQSLRAAIAAADQAGVIFVAAAGNDGHNSDLTPSYPSSYSVGNIISVAATDNRDTMPPFSNYGRTTVDLAAPGVLIESTYPTWKENPPYHFLSGTSMASPQVAGAAALLWSENPELTHRQVIDRILQGTIPLPDLNGKSVTGGRLDLAESFALGSPHRNHAPLANAGASQSRNLNDRVVLQATATDADGDAPLTFLWTITSPLHEISSFVAPHIFFLADHPGTYSATLVVSDGKDFSLPATVRVFVSASAANSPENPTDHTNDPTNVPKIPTLTVLIEAQQEGSDNSLDPSQGEKVAVGNTVFFNGTGSHITSSAGDEALNYDWILLEKPSGSDSLLQKTDQSVASFVPDLEGRYTIQLEVSAGKTSSRAEIGLLARSDVAAENTGQSPAASTGGCSLFFGP